MPAMERAGAGALQGRAVLAAATRTMLDVEELGAGATGAIVFGARERSRGAVLVESGRVCWIGASGLSRRLTDLLIQETDPPPDRRIVTTLFEECRREGRPLGERLVEAGVVRPEGLRRALLRHSTEALVLLSRDATSRHLWVPHRSQRYDATFTFAPCELAAAVAAEVLPEVHAAAAAELDEMLGGEAAGVALDREGSLSAPLIVAHAGTEAATVAGAIELARWTVGALDLAGAIAPRSTLSIASRSDGAALIAWARAGLLFGAACGEPSVASCVVARYARRAG